MQPQIKGDIAKERHREVTEIIKAKNYEFRLKHSSDLEVLLENGKEGVFYGYDQYFNKIEVKSDEDLSSNWVLLNEIKVQGDGNYAQF